MPFTLTTAQVPAVQVASDLLNVEAATPVNSPQFTAGNPDTVLAVVGEIAARVDWLGRHGGGGRAVVQGLDLGTSANLNMPVAAGAANVDGAVMVPTATTHAIEPSIARTHVWISRAGTLTHQNNSLAVPAGGPWAYLGSGVTSGTAVTSVDQSGVMYQYGGFLWRRTTDQGAPTDTPPATARFFHQTLSGLYFWDGAAYVRIWERAALQADSVQAGETLYIPAGYQAALFGRASCRGRVVNRGRMRLRG